MTGKLVRLRAMEPSDINLLYEWENRTDLWYVSCNTLPFSKETLSKFVHGNGDLFRDGQHRFMINECLDNSTVGAVDLFDYSPVNLRAGIGILIADPNHRNKGYAADAVSVMMEYCKHTLNLKQIFADIDAGNDESQKLFEKVGFEFTGVRKSWKQTGGKWEDVLFCQYIFK